MFIQNVPVIEKTYQLLLYLLPVLREFPRTQKYLLADRIEERVLDVLADLQEAYQNVEVRKVLLGVSNRNLEKLRFLFRLSVDMHFMDSTRHEYISKEINEIGKMIGGWVASTKT